MQKNIYFTGSSKPLLPVNLALGAILNASGYTKIKFKTEALVLLIYISRV
jgi:hypothetical protein